MDSRETKRTVPVPSAPTDGEQPNSQTTTQSIAEETAENNPQEKNLDNHNRWRNKTVAFRVSPEEDEQLEIAVRLSGLTKQDYITRRLLNRDIVVQGNPRVYKALRDQLAAVLGELRRMEAGGGVDDELLATIRLITMTLDGMKED